MSAELLRHVNALVADFAAEYGAVDLVGRRVDCALDEYDALVETFDAFGVIAGAGVRLRDDEGRVLLASYGGADGWVDLGDGRRPRESCRECAVRGIREATGLDPEIDDLVRVHLLYVDDWTDRPRYRTRTSSPRAGRCAETPAPGTSGRVTTSRTCGGPRQFRRACCTTNSRRWRCRTD